jgi:aminobenzoyl-glutamate transport protein
VLSWVLQRAGVAVTNPSTGKHVAVVNLLSVDGLHRILLDAAKNFLAYPPLGISLTCLLGIGVAEHAGLLGACLRLVVLASPARQITPTFIVLAFFAAQFIAYFNWTNLGIVLAVQGANLVTHLGLERMPTLLMVALVLFATTVNLLISSASAKWALLAPVFVPMFMLLGYSPELVQSAFRVGDSVTNIITPLLSYIPLIPTFAQKYEPQAGIGTMVATMLPYSIVFGLVWTVLLIAWIALGVPMGPGAPLFLPK